MDLSEAMEAARENTRHLPNVHLIQGDIFHLPLRARSLDFSAASGFSTTPRIRDEAFSALPGCSSPEPLSSSGPTRVGMPIRLPSSPLCWPSQPIFLSSHPLDDLLYVFPGACSRAVGPLDRAVSTPQPISANSRTRWAPPFHSLRPRSFQSAPRWLV